ncbi:MAG: hypothetical protein QM530_01615 [Phycisphaerales bacterium]|nr:hypothetical protein [Phycisphaerales bacterium]
MKKLIMSVAALMSLTASFVACKKSDSSTVINNPTPGSYTSLFGAYSDLAPKSKTVIINAISGGSFYGNSGTRYEFQPNSFQTLSGTVVTGNVDIQVLECTNNADMIFGKMLTMSDGQPLISAGEISLSASQGGVAVNIRPGKNYTVSLPTNRGAATAGMYFFRGASTESYAGTTTNWSITKDSLLSIIYDGDTVRMTPDSTGNSNVDKFSSAGFASVDVKLTGVTGAINAKDVMTYYVLEGYMGVASMPTANFSANTYSSSAILKLKSHLVACCIYNGDFYGGILSSVSPTDGTTYTISLSKTTPAALKVLINALK